MHTGVNSVPTCILTGLLSKSHARELRQAKPLHIGPSKNIKVDSNAELLVLSLFVVYVSDFQLIGLVVVTLLLQKAYLLFFLFS